MVQTILYFKNEIEKLLIKIKNSNQIKYLKKTELFVPLLCFVSYLYCACVNKNTSFKVVIKCFKPLTPDELNL